MWPETLNWDLMLPPDGQCQNRVQLQDPQLVYETCLMHVATSLHIEIWVQKKIEYQQPRRRKKELKQKEMPSKLEDVLYRQRVH